MEGRSGKEHSGRETWGHVWPSLDFRMRGLDELSECCDALDFMLPLPCCYSNVGDALSSSSLCSITCGISLQGREDWRGTRQNRSRQQWCSLPRVCLPVRWER